MKHVVMLESNTSGSGFRAIREARDSGHEITFVTRDVTHYTRKDPRVRSMLDCAHEILETETNDIPALVDEMRRLETRRPVHGVMTYGDYYTEAVARVAVALDLPGPDPEAVAVARNKHRSRVSLAHLPFTPAFEITTRPEHVPGALRRVGLPCVVKPVDRNSGGDVRKVATEQEAVEHASRIFTAGRNARGQEASKVALFEEFIEGSEYSVETFGGGATIAVIGVTTKELVGHPHFVEAEHLFPAPLPAEAENEAIACVLKALYEIGLTFGPAHTEVKLTPCGPRIIEINPRLGGNLIPDLVRLATGFDLGRTLLLATTGEPVDLSVTRSRVAGIRFLTADRAGVLTSYAINENIEQIPGLESWSITAAPGRPVSPPTDNNHYLGHVIATAETAGGVVAALDAAAAAIDLQIEECA